MNLRFEPACADDLEPLYALNESLIRQYEDFSAISCLDPDKILAWVRRKLEKKLSEKEGDK